MAQPIVVSALIAKRAEISGYIEGMERKIKNWRARLAHIDATIEVFSPETDTDAIPPKRTYARSNYFKHGELARLCQDQLRKAEGKPRPTAEIVTAIASDRGLPIENRALFLMLIDKAIGYFRQQVKMGRVVNIGHSHNARWAISPSLL
jgi:hypothetical protein